MGLEESKHINIVCLLKLELWNFGFIPEYLVMDIVFLIYYLPLSINNSTIWGNGSMSFEPVNTAGHRQSHRCRPITISEGQIFLANFPAVHLRYPFQFHYVPNNINVNHIHSQFNTKQL